MEKEIKFILNNRMITTKLDPLMSTLKFLRDDQGLKSVKLSCGEGECGACTVLLGDLTDGTVKYRNVASCILPIGDINGKHLVTLEGINGNDLNLIQKIMVSEGAIQCGFCTPGFVMSMTGFFLDDVPKTDKNILNAIDGNICRCTGYVPIRRASKKLVNIYESYEKTENTVEKLIELSLIPSYFKSIPKRLSAIPVVDNESDFSKDKLLVAGGTDLLIGDKVGKVDKEPQFLFERKELREIFIKKNMIYIGSGVTTEQIRRSEIIKKSIKDIDKFLTLVSSSIIRNRATLGGNIVNASPIGDLSVLFLAVESSLIISSQGNEREIMLKDFFKGYKDFDLNKGEIIKYLKFRKTDEDERINFEKVSRRKHLDIASCNSGIRIRYNEGKIQTCSISAGGVAPVPLFLKKISSFLEGKFMNEHNLKEAVEFLKDEISPISDIRGSAVYKKELMVRLIISHFIKLFPDIIDPGEIL